MGQVLAGSRSSSPIGYLRNSHLEGKKNGAGIGSFGGLDLAVVLCPGMITEASCFCLDPASSLSGLTWCQCWRNCVSPAEHHGQPPVPGGLGRAASAAALLPRPPLAKGRGGELHTQNLTIS